MQNFEERLRTCVRQEGRHLSDIIFRDLVINANNQNCIYYRLFWCWYNSFILKINKVTIIWKTCVLFAPPARSSKWSFSFWLFLQYSVCISLRPTSCYMSCLSQPPELKSPEYYSVLSTNFWYFSLFSFLQPCGTSSFLRTHVSFTILFSNTLCIFSSLYMRNRVPSLYTTTSVCCVSVFMIR